MQKNVGRYTSLVQKYQQNNLAAHDRDGSH